MSSQPLLFAILFLSVLNVKAQNVIAPMVVGPSKTSQPANDYVTFMPTVTGSPDVAITREKPTMSSILLRQISGNLIGGQIASVVSEARASGAIASASASAASAQQLFSISANQAIQAASKSAAEAQMQLQQSAMLAIAQANLSAENRIAHLSTSLADQFSISLKGIQASAAAAISAASPSVTISEATTGASSPPASERPNMISTSNLALIITFSVVFGVIITAVAVWGIVTWNKLRRGQREKRTSQSSRDKALGSLKRDGQKAISRPVDQSSGSAQGDYAEMEKAQPPKLGVLGLSRWSDDSIMNGKRKI